MRFLEFIYNLRKHGYGIVAMNEYSDSEDTMCLYVVVKKIGGNLCAKSEGFDYESIFDRIIADLTNIGDKKE